MQYNYKHYLMPSVYDIFSCKLAMSRWLAGSMILTHLETGLSILLNASNENAVTS